ncbi:hypothetical protein AcV7_008727 [Taiwanofungus camphoratus]|nr:hypothetical protein AcV7_008727 [Antrodia cinnamomea]
MLHVLCWSALGLFRVLSGGNSSVNERDVSRGWAACGASGQWNVQALPGHTCYYSGPMVAQADACTCSSVAYSLVSACAYCQDGSKWTYNCSSSEVVNGQYSHDIPGGTAFPAWAYAQPIADWAKHALAAAMSSSGSRVKESTNPYALTAGTSNAVSDATPEVDPPPYTLHSEGTIQAE